LSHRGKSAPSLALFVVAEAGNPGHELREIGAFLWKETDGTALLT
jgi:hypothetical protein